MSCRLSRWATGAALVFVFMLLVAPGAEAQVEGGPVVTIDQDLGIDQRVVYKELTRFGVWDDRNYQLRLEDLAVLPADDQYLVRVPAWFKIQKRREMIAEGFPLMDLYPREMGKEFEFRFGGPIQNGVLQRRGLGIYRFPDPANPPPPIPFATDPLPHAVPIEGEGPFDGVASDNETSIEFHPTDPQIAIAGSNGTGGQRQSFTTDGGVTWMSAGALPSSCCDPAMDWSPDGSIAYAATLGNATGGGGGFRTEIYRSTNNGQTWSSPVNVSTASSDKEFVHVDKSPTSPFLGRVYVTWHQGNVMCFARSTQTTPALTFAPTQCFPAEERGIGSDITTDSQGNIYYVYPSLTTGSTEIRVLRSTDGGVTFLPSVAAYDLWGRFDFPIPSMETREAFTYVATDVDRSGGARDGRVYIALTDTHPSSPAGGTGTAAQNHGWVQVAYSDDQGATWTTATTPHAVSDIATVDRYHPWLDVDDQGIVHIGFYDTRHSANRTGVDWYYVFSADGGSTWVEETRVSALTSQNITDGQEWGDYNGLSVSQGGSGTVVGMTWTDNRIPPPGPNPLQRSFIGRVTNVGAGPTFLVAASGTLTQSVCTLQPGPAAGTLFANSFEFGGSVLAAVTLNVSALNGFTSTVNFSFNPALPTGFEGTFSPPSLTPPGSSVATIGVTPAAAPGSYAIGLLATGGTVTRQSTINVNVSTALPGAPALVAPSNNATGTSTTPTLSWTVTQGSSSIVEVATDNSFTNIVFTGSATAATSIVVGPALQNFTQYFWRVRSTNTCGTGTNSPVFSFRTASPAGQCDPGATANTVFFDNIENGDNGWVATAGTGSQNWARSTARPFSPANAWLAVDVETTSDQRLASPPIVLPSGENPLTLRFQQDRTLEPRSGGGCWDGGFVEVSADNGGSWTQATPAQVLQPPYTGTLGAGPASGQQAWCGTVPYAMSLIDLSSYAGQTVRLRFRVSTDSSVGFEPHGWYIDDVRVQSCPSP